MVSVLIICGKLYIGGAEKVAYSLGLYRDPKEYQIDYLVFGDDVGAYENELRSTGCRIHHISSPGESYLRFCKILAELIRRYRYSVIHCHTMFNSGFVMTVARLMNVPVRICHSHSICYSNKRKIRTRIYEHVMRKLIQLNSTDWIACGTAAGEWLYGKTFFHRKGSVILNGIDVNAFKFCESKRNEIRNRYMLENKYVVGHVGHLSTVKNQVFLLDLMKTIVVTRPETVLIMLGEGDQRQLIEDKIKEYKLENNVILTGNVMNVADYLSAMDVFAFPSLYEGMPLSIIEVQANGLPAIVSDRVPTDVFLTDLITILSLENREGWFEAIHKVSRDHPEKYSDFLLERGYDSATMVRKIYNIYEKGSVYH